MSSISQTAFFSAGDGSLRAYLWRWQDPNTSFDWIHDTSASPAHSTFVDSSDIILIAIPNSDFSFDFRKLDFTQPNVIVWTSRIASATGGTLTGFVTYESSSTYVFGLGMFFLIT